MGPSEFSDPNVPIQVRVGDVFAIVLESNATTGYSWRLAGVLEPSIVRLRSSTYEAPQSGLVGAGGRERWTLQAMGPGETTIALEYVRPWEDQPPAQTATFQLIVSKR